MIDLLFNFKDEFVREGLLKPEHLAFALEKKNKTQEPLLPLLTQMGWVIEAEAFEFLGKKLGTPYTKIDQYTLDPGVASLIPEAMARKYQVLPLFLLGNQLTLAMANPLDLEAIEAVRLQTQCKIDRVLSNPASLMRGIDMVYANPASLKKEVEALFGKNLNQLGVADAAGGTVTGEAPLVKLLDLVFLRALQNRVSDVHLEPEETFFRIRYRIDGKLEDILALPKWMEDSIISRIKVLANLDITEKRLPQDGRISHQVDDRDIDLRVSIINTILGEKCVVRVLDRATAFQGFEALGFLPHTQELFQNSVQRTTGVILVTGPTGSGKTSTLYSVLRKINTPEQNIITIEDPVEYHIEGINQIQVEPKIGLTFATGLRSILRQDPDIVMVGEIRDVETAEIAIHAALTGHLVFSTLHTGSAAKAIIRLMEMGVKPFLIASSLTGILAQRLIRTICQHCRTKYTPTREVIEQLNLDPSQYYLFFKGKGCRNCNGSGFKGRTGLFEYLTVNEEIRSLLTQNPSHDAIETIAKEQGMVTLIEDGIAKIFTGITTAEEVLRVVNEEI